MWRLIRDLLLIACNLNFWMMLNKYSSLWDYELNELMKKHKFTQGDGYTARLGSNEIWVTNYPYGSFTGSVDGKKVRPSRLTILRARRKLKKDLEEAKMQQRSSTEILREAAIKSQGRFAWIKRHL